MTVKPCIVCGRLTDRGARCAEHDHRLGYQDPAYRRAARAVRVASVGQRCPTCGEVMLAPTAGHRVALTAGGTNDLSNLAGQCARCNYGHRPLG